MNKNVLTSKGNIIKLKIGENDVEIKTTSIHHLTKKYAKKVFKDYCIVKDRNLNFENFKSWVVNHKNLYNDYFRGFHNEVWEVDSKGLPLYQSLASAEFRS